MIGQKIKKLFPALLVITGIGIVAVAVVADQLLTDGQAGFGVKQKTATLAGILITLIGFFLITPYGRKAAQVIAAPPEQYNKPVSILLSALWFGMLTGFGEVLIQGYHKFIMEQNISMNLHMVWMIPVGNVLIFMVLGFFLFIGERLWPRLGSIRITTFVFLLFSLTSWLLLFPKLHDFAVILLVIGLAFQLSRMHVNKPERLNLLIYNTVAWMAGLVVIIVIGVAGGRYLIEQRRLMSLPQPAENPQNVLLITLDTVRAEDLSLYGYIRETTPQLERWASKGVLFDWAISSSPWTLPSHASMFTGHYPHKLSANWTTPLDDSYVTLAEIMRNNGYQTVGFVGNLIYCNFEMGLARGFIRYEDFPLSLGQMTLNLSLGRAVSNFGKIRSIFGYYDVLNRKPAGDLNERFLNWLDHRDSQHPFFAFINYFDAHEPYLPPKPFDTMFGPNHPRAEFNYQTNEVYVPEKWNMTQQQIQVERDAYDGAIAYLDAMLGELLENLQERGVLDNTLVIITSDHGEQFGEHGLFDHGNSLFMQNLRVPLLILFPLNAPEGLVVNEAVSLIDIPSTILDLLQFGDKSTLPGESLALYWDQNSNMESSSIIISEVSGGFGEEWFPTTKGDMYSLVNGNYHYILEADGREQLYNFLLDPAEFDDLSKTNNGLHEIQYFRMMIKDTLSESIEQIFPTEGVSQSPDDGT